MKRVILGALLLTLSSISAHAQLVTVISLSGIPGESIVPGYEDTIDVESWTQAASNVNGTPLVLPLEFVHKVDSASPKLFEAAILGSNVGPAILTSLRTDGGSLEFYTEIKLTGVQVISVRSSGSDGSGLPLETVRLSCAGYTYSYWPTDENGNLQAPIDVTGSCSN